MERYVAIDNVCAWPNLTLMPDQSIVATIFNQPTHGGWEGDVECWGSDDGGRTWARRGVPAPHEPRTNRMNVAAGLGQDGALIVVASGWDCRPPSGEQPAGHAQANVLRPWVCRSQDGARSWSRDESVELPSDGTDRIIPFGDIVRLGAGRLGVAFYSWAPPDEHRSLFYESTDDGSTWHPAGVIAEAGTNETDLLVLPDGRLLAAARTLGDAHLELYGSGDGGRTWQGMCGALSLGHQHPAHLLGLRDGRVLLTYGLRNRGLYGVGARLSRDGGETWEAPRVLANFAVATDGGYPSSVQAADGTIVTAYYCNRIAFHERYHMGVVLWDVDGD